MHLSILLVDDDAATRFTLRRAFRRLDVGGVDIQLQEAGSGEEALDVLRARGATFHVVVSDYKMGPVNGTEVLSAALELAPDALRVLMSGYADEDVVDEARRVARIHEFREKPMDYGRFEDILREVVHRAVNRLTARPT